MNEKRAVKGHVWHDPKTNYVYGFTPEVQLDHHTSTYVKTSATLLVDVKVLPKKVTRNELEAVLPNAGAWTEELLKRILSAGYDDGKPEITSGKLEEAWMRIRDEGRMVSIDTLCKELGLPDEGE